MPNLYHIYLSEISKYQLLEKEEEVALIYKAQNGNKKAFDNLVLANQRFIISVAKKFTNQGLDLLDLISLGNLGLIEAIDRFDPTTGHKLISYAVWWIKQKIMEGIGNDSRVIRLPANRGSEVQEIIKEFKNIQLDSSHLHLVTKVCNRYKISEAELVNRVNIYYMTNSNYRDKILLDPENLIAEDFMEVRLSLDTKIILMNKIDTLKDRQVYIATNYFDLFGNSKTLESIGEELNLTRERIRQIKVQIIKKLSSYIEKNDFNDTMLIPYSLLRIKENSYSEEASVLYELSNFVNENYHVVEKLKGEEIDVDQDYDLNDDLLMELYDAL